MPQRLVLASGSEIRQRLLRNANVQFDVEVARVDEDMLRRSLCSEGAKPRDVADALAEIKALKISEKNPGALVIGCDQVLDFDGKIMSKPQTVDEAHAQLTALRGQRHSLLSAAVICEDGQPIWRHVGHVRLRMREFSDDYLSGYLDRNWPEIRHCVGAYKLEEEGVRLFSRVEGDYFTVLGLPLFELLSYLTLRGELQT
ncbi:Maf family protein [Thalassovita taeanensis]|uniref:Nucleoside triphosphate pyrophosphatase n=1 Tax=Thalassovita taeanensis TaxID=657014 RepID=A0A1H9JJ62_9RHOB|nr:Maf family nucleotide pyrophosphatase [Thalassovita taeanensis]SEQ86912.1 septum formation protein [Thalassovita taeanensis]